MPGPRQQPPTQGSQVTVCRKAGPGLVFGAAPAALPSKLHFRGHCEWSGMSADVRGDKMWSLHTMEWGSSTKCCDLHNTSYT